MAMHQLSVILYTPASYFFFTVVTLLRNVHARSAQLLNSLKTTQLLSKGLSGHSELTAYKQDGLHQSAHSSVGFRWLLHRLAALPMSMHAATMN